MGNVDTVPRIALAVVDVRGDAAQLRNAIQGHADRATPRIVDSDVGERWVDSCHFAAQAVLDDRRIIAEVVDATAEQQPLVGTQTEVL